ncbi:toxin-antitoxin system HicB family antitoxin [Phytoactinopolyspora halotolerans]|uniref:Toxin-antitoxin system HicB family antitoxin n=1 Tax=Phytoactinopolyspora halotolerans TaxID=1981512 RepID=A0A6L9SF28_9ACTN|nr:toxin-antitoxin system HicB family antitoxin [Phytoactinopolyspora halotolerans]NEE04035.1 toxin-antitoxin system HicB family antitoxin [Phytoactinopolyspora halotolerans]
MRQLLLRIPDDLHARLTAKAKREGISVNALANKALHSAAPAEGPADGVTTRRYRLKERAREMGILVESPAPPVTPERFSAALKETEGIGPVVTELWTKGR